MRRLALLIAVSAAAGAVVAAAAGGLFSPLLVRGLGAVAIVAAVAWAIGWAVLARLGGAVGARGDLAEHAFAFLLGLGGLATVGLGLALVGLYRPVVLALAIAVAVPLAIRIARGAELVRRPDCSIMAGVARAIVGVVAGVSLLASLPPVAWLDALEYHGALPSLYLLEGGIVDLPNNFFSHFPHLIQLALGFVIALEPMAPLGFLNWLATAALALGVMRLSELLVPGSGWIAAALLWTAHELAAASMAPGVDVYIAALAVHALYRLVAADLRGRADAVAPCLVAAGLILASKLHGPLTVGALAAAAVYAGGLRPRLLADRRVQVASVAVVLLPAPFFIRTLLAHGNPIWPFLTGDPAIRAWVERVVWYTQVVGIDGGDLSALPVALGRFFFRRDGWNATLLIGLAGTFVASGFWRRREARSIALFAAVIVAGWVVGARVPRYAMPAAAALAAVAGAGVAVVAGTSGGRGRRVWLAAAALPMALSASAIVIDLVKGRDFIPWIGGYEEPMSYLERAMDASAQAVVLRASDELPADALVVSFAEPRLMHLRRRWRASTAFDPPLLAALLADADGPLAEHLYRELIAAGCTHVLVNPPYAEYLEARFPQLLTRKPEEQEALRTMLETRAKLVFARNGAGLYELERESPGS